MYQINGALLFLLFNLFISCKAKQIPAPHTMGIYTPEMYGAIADGRIHLLSEKYKNLADARADYPGVKDLTITIDGAAFQKAVDVTSANGGGNINCEKNYVINYPIETKNNVTIDGLGKGKIFNDCSRKKFVHHLAFFIGDHHPVAFNPNNEVPGAYTFYDVANPVLAGDNSVAIKDFEKFRDSFKIGQLVWLTSKEKYHQMKYAWFMAQSVTCKITNIKEGRLYFEHPAEEPIDQPQVAGNGGIDRFMEITFSGVENVIIRNLTIDAGSLTNHTWGYKCLIENIKLINTTHLIVLNTLDRSTIRNVKGTYYKRCIEVKSGANHLTIKNIQATFKAPDTTKSSIGIISTGEYNRHIVIDSFFIDMKDSYCDQSIITLQARNATISNGKIESGSHTKPFIKFYNDYNVDKPEFAAYHNTIKNIIFNGNQRMPILFIIGDPPDVIQRFLKEEKKTNFQWPVGNTIENCVMNGGNSLSKADLYGGWQNRIIDCKFVNTKLSFAESFLKENEINK